MQGRQPGVLVGLPADTKNLDVYDLDFPDAARTLVDHLQALGHQEICLITPPRHVYERGGSYAWRFRDAALERATEHGMRFTAHYGESRQPAIDESLNRILDGSPNATALIMHNDASVAVLPAVLHSRGVRVPDDLSVVSLYSKDFARSFSLPDTAVESSPDKLGRLKAAGHGSARLSVNDESLATVTRTLPAAEVFLRGGVNKVVVTGLGGSLAVDSLGVRASAGTLPTKSYEAESADIAGTAKAETYSLASGKKAVTGIGGAPGNGNTLTFHVKATKSGVQMVTVRYSNPEQSPATHYNPDPLARHADVSVNGGKATRVSFPHSFHQNNFWELSFPVKVAKGSNTILFSSEELPNFDGKTYASDLYEEPLRSKFAPNIDRISLTPLSDTKSLTSRR
jgi:hypothetical protein